MIYAFCIFTFVGLVMILHAVFTAPIITDHDE